jgi:catalase
LIQNIAGSLKKVPKELQEKMVAHFSKADKDYGGGLAKDLGL